MRSASPSPSEKRISATASGSACRCRMPSRCASGEHRGDLFARAPHQPGVLGGDVLVAAREREQLEDERDELGVLVHGLLQVLRHQVDVVVGRLRARRAVARAAPCAARSRGARPRRAAAPWCRSSSAAGRARRRPRARRGRTSSRRCRGARRCGASPRRSAGPSRRTSERPAARPAAPTPRSRALAPLEPCSAASVSTATASTAALILAADAD